MRFFLLLGGFSGFLIGFIASLLGGNPPADAFLRGAVCCLAGALLLKGLHLILMICLRAHIERIATGRPQPENFGTPASPDTRS